jgi:hypothetical protein
MHTNSDAENTEVVWSCGRPTRKWEGNKNKQTEYVNKTMRALSAGRKFRSPNCDVALLRKSSVSEIVFSSVPLGHDTPSPVPSFRHSETDVVALLARKYIPKRRIIRKILCLVIAQKSYNICRSTYQPDYTASHLRRPIRRLRNH